MIRLTQTAVLATGLFAVALLSGGCSSQMTSSDLRSDWTPELHSAAHSEEQYDNFRSRHRHNTWRQIHDDWALIWLEDRNLRLTRYTLP